MEESRAHSFRIKLGIAIRRTRESRSLSLRQFGAMVGLSYPFLSQVERGISSPTVDSLVRIADGLGVDVGDLFLFEKKANLEYDSSSLQ